MQSGTSNGGGDLCSRGIGDCLSKHQSDQGFLGSTEIIRLKAGPMEVDGG